MPPRPENSLVKGLFRLLTVATWACASACLAAPARDVTFLSTSDSHYREPDHRAGCSNDLNRASVLEMNRIPGLRWPEELGGGKIGRPRGVLVLGDVIDDGDRAEKGRGISAEQYGFFVADFGLTGKDGLLKYPVFEGWGNHDGPPAGKELNGFSYQDQLKRRNLVRKDTKQISNLSPNGLHYSWDWDDVHFVQLGIYAADKQRAGVRYSPVWHDPQGALSFLKEDLAANVGGSGRPVVLMAHCGFDTDWWVAADWADLYAAAKPYNVVLYLFGHSGTGVGAWTPPGESRKWTLINDGQTGAGFFVINLKGDRLRAAYRMKSGVKYSKASDGKQEHTWEGRWEWKWPVDQKVPLAPRPEGQ